MITDADRRAAWPAARFHCLPDTQMRERWFAGWYDDRPEGYAIRNIAGHRADVEDAHRRGVAEGLKLAHDMVVATLQQIAKGARRANAFHTDPGCLCHQCAASYGDIRDIARAALAECGL